MLRCSYSAVLRILGCRIFSVLIACVKLLVSGFELAFGFITVEFAVWLNGMAFFPVLYLGGASLSGGHVPVIGSCVRQ